MSKQKYPQSASTTASGAPAKKGREHYSSAKLHAKWDRRRKEATERDTIYAGLSIQARINLAKSRRGESKRELARLEKLLTAQPKTGVTAKAPVTEKKHQPNKKGYNPSRDSLATHESFA